jgi:3-hydroxyacyl-[acyl-carrier-protein] dehydratase
MLVDNDMVLKLIPQKYPMVMVDELISNDEVSTVSRKKLLKDNIFCKDGYFQEPGIIENFAQTAALRSGYMAFLNNETPSVGYIGSVKRLRIYKLPEQNDILETKISIVNQFKNVLIVAGETRVGETIIAEGEMNIFLQ